MKRSPAQRPTIRRLDLEVKKRRLEGYHLRRDADHREYREGSFQLSTLIIGAVSITAAVLSALFSYQQAQIAARAPVAQAVAVQQVQGCGVMMRAFKAAQFETVSAVSTYGGGAVMIPNEVGIRTAKAIMAANEAGESNTLFFDVDQQIVINSALEVLLNDRLIANMADDNRLQGVPSATSTDLNQTINDRLMLVQLMCRSVMYPD